MLIHVQGIGLLGPGLADWKQAASIFKGDECYAGKPLPDPIPTMLPPNEFRRSSDMVRWSLQVAQEAITQARVHPQEVCTVFASSEGESSVLQDIFFSLANEERMLSPTLFHHSGHNAAAGYWSIATKSQQSSTSLSCFDDSFTGGLIEVAMQVISMQIPGLLVACDIPPPLPLFSARSLVAPFAVALLFNDQSNAQTRATLDVQIRTESQAKPTSMIMPALETLRQGNPAARSLPLLVALAREENDGLDLPFLNDQCIQIGVTSHAGCHL